MWVGACQGLLAHECKHACEHLVARRQLLKADELVRLVALLHAAQPAHYAGNASLIKQPALRTKGHAAERLRAGAYFDVLRYADAYIEANGLPFPLEPEAWELLPDPKCLPNLVNRASSFIYGVWHDAKYVADHIVLQNEYMSYNTP